MLYDDPRSYLSLSIARSGIPRTTFAVYAEELRHGCGLHVNKMFAGWDICGMIRCYRPSRNSSQDDVERREWNDRQRLCGERDGASRCENSRG